MTDIERFWLDLMDARRYAITEVYGAECASRYKPHPIEKEYFISPVSYTHLTLPTKRIV